jgi:ectoine hydroxylase-related dioxygenase (phytanoyl-CoA dioxygenase family)
MNRHQVSLVHPRVLAPWLQGRSFDDWRAQFDHDGYVIFPNVMTRHQVERVRTELTPHLVKRGRNDFEGFNSNRVYALLAKSPAVFSDMVTHPLALAFAEADLGASCLLSALLAINLLPGETVQRWHRDDGATQIPLPRPAYGVSTFWAIDPMTAENGATELVPRSHLWTDDPLLGRTEERAARDVDDDPEPRTDAIKATMPAGSLMVTKGNLLHRGGANRSTAPRLIVTPQYCPGWARQIENMMASVPREIAAHLPKRTRQLLGYSIHGAFMGYVDGVHPDRLLGISD